jgi:hypothetical protein
MYSKHAHLTLLAAGCMLAGCAIETAEPASSFSSEQFDESSSDLSASSRSYVTVRHDDRKCMAPMCGGYWVKDVNKTTAEQYVSALDFGSSGLDEVLIGKVLEAPAGELVLNGKLGPKEQTYKTRMFRVFEAYRGMPGVEPIVGDIFYKAEDRDPPIQCFAAPCPNEVASKLNTSTKKTFDGYQVELAARPHVDQDWLIDRVNHHGAIVAALILNGVKYPAGYEKILDASQVYLNVADMTDACPTIPLAPCPDGAGWTFTRDVGLCLDPNACVEDGNCPSLAPPQCEEGYAISSWRVASPSCRRFACDPAFVLPN